MKDNKEKNRFELEENGHVAFADYRLEDKTLFIKYVEAPLVLRGLGTAGRLMQDISEHALANNLKIVPICGYASSWLKRNKEFSKLVA